METRPSSVEWQISGSEEVAQLEYFPAADDNHRYLRLRCSMLCAAFNAQPLSISKEERARGWYDIADPDICHCSVLPEAPMIKSPIHINYCSNLRIASSCFINQNCIISNAPGYPITIGENTLIGPGVHIHAVTHPTDWRERKGRKGPSLAGPVAIGNDCWIGSYAVIMPGITIGDGCVIGASSVVTRSIPAYHVAVGNPARPIRKVDRAVPDAPGLSYENRGAECVVLKRAIASESRSETTSDTVMSKHDQVIEAENQLQEMSDKITSVVERRVAADMVILVAVVLVLWMTLRSMLY